MNTLLGALPGRAVLFFPVVALAIGFVQAKLLALFRHLLGAGVAELLVVLGGLVLTASRPDWFTLPLRWFALLGIESAEPAALAIPALLGQLAIVALAWTSRPWEPHPLDAVRTPAALAVILFSTLVTLAVLGPWGALPLGLTALSTLGFHWYWHERTGGATRRALARAGDWTECLTLAFSAWLF